MWISNLFRVRGVKQAAFVSTVATFAKVAPFIVVMIFMLKLDTFRLTIAPAAQEGRIVGQVCATMLVTVFVFIGIEGVSVYLRYAKERADVGRATIFGFVGVTALMVIVSMWRPLHDVSYHPRSGLNHGE